MVRRISFSSTEFYVGLMNMAASFSLAPGAPPIAAIPMPKPTSVVIEPPPLFVRAIASEARL